MGKTAILFPGQGAQKVGMGRDLYDALPAARQVYDRANAALDIDITTLCFDGPKDELNDTAVCQAAVLVTSLAALEALRARHPAAVKADLTAGLSLGEYTALVFAGAVDLEDAVRLVRQRGLFMKEAGKARPGGMVSIIGPDRAAVMQIVDDCQSEGTLVAANFNSPQQVVLSGSSEAVDCAARLATERGARRAIKLAVSAAFHSPLMEPAAEKLKAELEKTAFRAPQVPLVSNVSARYVETADQVRDLLARQLTSPVLWVDSMQFMIGEGVTQAIEVGPGRVLCGLLAKTDRSVSLAHVGALADLDAIEAG